MTDTEQRFAARAVRRKGLFLGLSIAGLIVAAALTILYAILKWRNPEFPIVPRAVIILLVLLNARQNLRQYRYARVLEELMTPPASAPASR